MFPFKKRNPRIIENKEERQQEFKKLITEDEKIQEIKKRNEKRGRKRKVRKYSQLELELLTMFTREGYNTITKREGRWGYGQGLTTPQIIDRLDYNGLFDESQSDDNKRDTISAKISKLKISLGLPFVYRNKGHGKRRYLCPEFEKEFFKKKYENRIDTYRYIQKILDEKSQVTEEDLEKEKIKENPVAYYIKKEEERKI